MGLFGFVTNLTSAGIKIALAPAAVVIDTVNIATGHEPDVTMNLLQSAGEDIGESVDQILPD